MRPTVAGPHPAPPRQQREEEGHPESTQATGSAPHTRVQEQDRQQQERRILGEAGQRERQAAAAKPSGALTRLRPIGLHPSGDRVGRDRGAHDLYLDYYAEMGIDPSFYWFTLDAAGSDDIHWMTRDELSLHGLTSADPAR